MAKKSWISVFHQAQTLDKKENTRKNSAKTQRIEREKMIDWNDASSDRNENISGIWNIHKKEKWCVNLFRSCFPSPVVSYKPKKRARSGEREMEILLPRRRFNTLKSIIFLLLLPSLRRVIKSRFGSRFSPFCSWIPSPQKVKLCNKLTQEWETLRSKRERERDGNSVDDCLTNSIRWKNISSGEFVSFRSMLIFSIVTFKTEDQINYIHFLIW